jgi:CheY-like chemotaxis protein
VPELERSKMQHRILIIDDEDDIREIAAMSLETVAGWEVMVANSGAQGLTRAAMYKPDAILLDVMMPAMDGPATLQKLRADPEIAALPVVFLTAKLQATDRRRLAELGAAGVLAKPFDPMTLADQVKEALGWT